MVKCRVLEGLHTRCIREIKAQLILYSVQNQGHHWSCLIGGDCANLLSEQVRLYLYLSDKDKEECVYLCVLRRHAWESLGARENIGMIRS